MLLLVTGSSCSGKSTACFGLPVEAGLRVHDSDELGVPRDADTAWRQRNLRSWVRRCSELRAEGLDLLLAAQSPIGELLAVPEASELDLAVCLVEVRDELRSDRLEGRQPGAWSAEAKHSFNGWAEWHRKHAADPQHRSEVITGPSAAGMRWDRWTSWVRGDARWSVETIDTSELSPRATNEALGAWASTTRNERLEGRLPLGRGWVDRR